MMKNLLDPGASLQDFLLVFPDFMFSAHRILVTINSKLFGSLRQEKRSKRELSWNPDIRSQHDELDKVMYMSEANRGLAQFNPGFA
jgi:hypothetical protein